MCCVPSFRFPSGCGRSCVQKEQAISLTSGILVKVCILMLVVSCQLAVFIITFSFWTFCFWSETGLGKVLVLLPRRESVKTWSCGGQLLLTISTGLQLPLLMEILMWWRLSGTAWSAMFRTSMNTALLRFPAVHIHLWRGKQGTRSG